MEIQARQLLVAVFGIVIAIGFGNGNAVQGETAPPVVVGLAKCSDCARRNMNAEAAFKGLQVAVKCKNSKGEYETTAAVGQVDKSGAFSVPLAADAVGADGELKSECFAQLHSASSAPCPGQEPSKIVAAPPGGHDGNQKTFVAVGGKVHRSSPECASAFLCHHFFHSIIHHHHAGIHTPVVIPHLPDHGHGHSVPPVTKPPAVDVPVHEPAPVTVPEHKPPSTPTTPSTPVYSPPKPTPIYHPPAQREAVTGP